MNSTDNRKGKGLTKRDTRGVFDIPTSFEDVMNAMIEEMVLHDTAVMRVNAMNGETELVSHEDMFGKYH